MFQMAKGGVLGGSNILIIVRAQQPQQQDNQNCSEIKYSLGTTTRHPPTGTQNYMIESIFSHTQKTKVISICGGDPKTKTLPWPQKKPL